MHINMISSYTSLNEADGYTENTNLQIKNSLLQFTEILMNIDKREHLIDRKQFTEEV